MTFTYDFVGPDQIRLLTPVFIDQNYMSFTLTSFDRSIAPPYVALSYTWGDEPDNVIIHLNRQRFSVRPNLWSFLYSFSKLQRDQHRGDFHLWADAICINQQSNQERNVQVRRMDETYRNAASVAAWLGLPPDLDQPSLSVPVGTLDIDPGDWDLIIHELVKRPYWTRYWVIQEFLLAKDVWIVCGRNAMHWQDFQDLVLREVVQVRSNYGTMDYSDPRMTSTPALPLVMGRNIDRYPELPQPLYRLLIDHCESQCKDPRDRVFALLGLTVSEERHTLATRIPDYDLSEDAVVVIALAHITSFPSHDTWDGKDAQRLYKSLGIEDKKRRESLLAIARRYDFLDDHPPDLDLWIGVEEAEKGNADGGPEHLNGQNRARESLTRSFIEFVVIGFIYLLRTVFNGL